MPYINCNRSIYANTEVDLIDIFLNDKILHKLLLKDIRKIVTNINIVRHSIGSMIGMKDGSDCDFLIKDNIREELLSSEGNQVDIYREILFLKFCLLTEVLSNHNKTTISNETIMTFLRAIENYIFENSIDIPFILQLKSSITLGDSIIKFELSHNETIEFLRFIDRVYSSIALLLIDIESKLLDYQKIVSLKRYPTPLILKENIYVKWFIEVEKGLLIRSLNNSKESNFRLQMPIYMINTDTLTIKLTDIIDAIIRDKPKNMGDLIYLDTLSTEFLKVILKSLILRVFQRLMNYFLIQNLNAMR